MYRLRSAIKGHVFVNFIVKQSDMPKDSISEPLWILKTDSSSKAVTGGAGMVLQSPKGLPIAHAVKFSFSILNNEAKYEAILFGL